MCVYIYIYIYIKWDSLLGYSALQSRWNRPAAVSYVRFETSVSSETTRRYIPEDSHLHTRRHENRLSHETDITFDSNGTRWPLAVRRVCYHCCTERHGCVVNTYFVFRRSRVQISAWRAAVLTEVFRRSPQSLHTSAGIVPCTRPGLLPSRSFPVHRSLITLCFHAVLSDILKKRRYTNCK
jgi:hypothetical protein